jgi:hypothetical protein
MFTTARINTFLRTTAVAGLIGAAAVGLAGTASAASTSVERGPDVVAVPQTYASPAAIWVPWSWTLNPSATVPHVDTTVHQSR